VRYLTVAPDSLLAHVVQAVVDADDVAGGRRVMDLMPARVTFHRAEKQQPLGSGAERVSEAHTDARWVSNDGGETRAMMPLRPVDPTNYTYWAFAHRPD